MTHATPRADVRVVLADDHPVVRQGLRALLGSLDSVTVVGEAATGREAVRQAVIPRPEVVLMDLQMPDLDGVAATREIAKVAPGVAVLVLTTFHDDAYILDALRAGARGYVLKGASQEEIARAISVVADGRAQSPTSVDACYRTANGALRLDTGTGCRPGESAIPLGAGPSTTRVVTDADEMSWNDQGVVYAMCDPGEVVVGGGYTIDNIGPNTFVNMDQPLQDEHGNQGWMIMPSYTAFEDDGYDGHVTEWAICTPGITTEAPWLD